MMMISAVVMMMMMMMMMAVMMMGDLWTLDYMLYLGIYGSYEVVKYLIFKLFSSFLSLYRLM